MGGAVAPLRIGVVGVGSLGFHHARIARELDRVQMFGCHDARPERAAQVAEQLGIPFLPSLPVLLDGIDALVVATPTTTHAEIATAALERGVHVLIEKPIASTLEQADEILSAAERSGALVQVGHVERFNTAIVAALPYLESPLFIESHRLAPFTARGTDVAVVLDLMIHDVDLVASLVGRPVASFEATGIPVLTPSVDIANARITFEGGAVANLTASRVSTERMRKLRIFQRSGYLSLNLGDGIGEFLRLKRDLPSFLDVGGGVPTPIASDIRGIVERIPLSADPVEPLRRQLESFRDAILSHRSPPVTGREGRDALATALAIEDRIKSHVTHTSSP